MWLQFAFFGGGGATMLRCGHCTKPFLVGTGLKRRSTSKYCGDACKVAAFKARQEA
jgi:hypothetical protein